MSTDFQNPRASARGAVNKKTRLAFYKGRKSENRKSLVGDWLICWVTGSQFSHVELVASMWPA